MPAKRTGHKESMSVLNAIHSLRSVRDFKPDKVPGEVIQKLLVAASMAASGSNTQPWEFIVVQNPIVKARLKEPMLERWLERMRGAVGMSQQMRQTYDDATVMLGNTEKVPVLIYCCLDLDRMGSKSEEVRYGSIYPAVQNLMLGAHALGLGTCLTVHGSTSTRGEPEVKEILGIPQNVKIVCLIYLGYPSKRSGRPKRKPIERYVHYDKW